MTLNTILQNALFVVAAVGLSACGGSGNGNTTNVSTGPSIEIKGQVVSSGVKSSVVTLKRSDNSVGSATTDTSSVYSFSVESIPDSFQLTATNSESSSELGTLLVGSPTAIYFASDNFSEYNITYLTALIDHLAFQESESVDIDSRTTVINRLVQLGMLTNNNDWYSLDPSYVDMTELNALVAESESLEVWLSEVTDDLSDNELSVDLARAFTHANGGVFSVSLGENNSISQYVGKEAYGVVTTYATEGVELEYQIKNSSVDATVNNDGEFRYNIPADATPNQVIVFDVLVSNKTNGLGKTLQVNVIPLEKQQEIALSLQPSSGDQAITNEDESTKLVVGTNELTEVVEIEIIDSINESGYSRSSIEIGEGYKAANPADRC